MATFKNSVNAFGNSAGDSTTANHTRWGGRGSLPKGKLKDISSKTADISGGNRRLAKSKVGTGGGSHTSQRGLNAFSKGKK